MFEIPCPYCGPRDQREFSYGGEAHIVRPKNPAELSNAEWADYVFHRTNTKGVFYEQWCHAHGCRQWFNVARNTASDVILAVYKIGEKPPKITEPNTPVTPSGEPPIGSGYNAWHKEGEASS